jgi:hypothetical protein
MFQRSVCPHRLEIALPTVFPEGVQATRIPDDQPLNGDYKVSDHRTYTLRRLIALVEGDLLKGAHVTPRKCNPAECMRNTADALALLGERNIAALEELVAEAKKLA